MLHHRPHEVDDNAAKSLPHCQNVGVVQHKNAVVRLQDDDRPSFSPVKPLLHYPIAACIYNVIIRPAKIDGGVQHCRSLCHGFTSWRCDLIWLQGP